MKLNATVLLSFAVFLAGCNLNVEPNVKNDTKNQSSSDKSKSSKIDYNDLSQFKDIDVSTLREGFGVGDLAPEISGQDAQGVSFSLSEYRGKVVMLDFWGDW